MTAKSRPFIVPVFLSQAGCPHQCAFCNQTAITGKKPRTPDTDRIRFQIETLLPHKGPKRKESQIAFYGGNFLGQPPPLVRDLLQAGAQFVANGRVDGIRFSTRPDTIDERRLDIVAHYPVKTVELGVQSMDDDVLTRSRRGHLASDVVRAVALLRERSFEVGLQLMVGLPGDTADRSLSSTMRVADLKPDFVRIYPTVVLAKSLLARWYRTGAYLPMTLETAVSLVKDMYLLFKRRHIAVVRMGLQASDDLERKSVLLSGPYHPAFGHKVHSRVFLDMALLAMRQFKGTPSEVTFQVHPNSASKLRGIKNVNMNILKQRFPAARIGIVTDEAVHVDMLGVNEQLMGPLDLPAGRQVSGIGYR